MDIFNPNPSKIIREDRLRIRNQKLVQIVTEIHYQRRVRKWQRIFFGQEWLSLLF